MLWLPVIGGVTVSLPSKGPILGCCQLQGPEYSQAVTVSVCRMLLTKAPGTSPCEEERVLGTVLGATVTGNVAITLDCSSSSSNNIRLSGSSSSGKGRV
jgi:hypothetical protein